MNYELEFVDFLQRPTDSTYTQHKITNFLFLLQDNF